MGEATLLDYSATKGAIVAFTRGLSQQLAGKGGSCVVWCGVGMWVAWRGLERGEKV